MQQHRQFYDRYITSPAKTVSLGLGREPLVTLCRRPEDFLAADALDNKEFRPVVVEQAAARKRDYRRCAD